MPACHDGLQMRLFIGENKRVKNYHKYLLARAFILMAIQIHLLWIYAE